MRLYFTMHVYILKGELVHVIAVKSLSEPSPLDCESWFGLFLFLTIEKAPTSPVTVASSCNQTPHPGATAGLQPFSLVPALLRTQEQARPQPQLVVTTLVALCGAAAPLFGTDRLWFLLHETRG